MARVNMGVSSSYRGCLTLYRQCGVQCNAPRSSLHPVVLTDELESGAVSNRLRPPLPSDHARTSLE